MPFPWKKVKSARISRLLNDHLLKSQKRRDGSSLVVETGFPTSLIDLFIKNREKLQKSSKKKRGTSLSQNDVDDPVIAGSPALIPSPPQSPSRVNSQVISGLPLYCSSPLRSASILHLSSGVSEIDVRDRDGGGAETKCGVERVMDAKGVILVGVKIFLVVILALGAKKLTVGITMSAFLLCFLECAGKHLRELMKPCSKAKGWLMWMAQKVPRLRHKDDRGVDQKKGGVSLWNERQEGSPKSDPSLRCCESRHQTQKIEIEKPNQYPITLIDEIQPEVEIVEDSCFKGRFRNQENDSDVVIGKDKSLFEVAKLRRKSRQDKIKSKVKLFVPKKFRSLRKEHIFGSLKVLQEDNDVAVCEEQGTEGCEDEWESETTSRLSSTSSRRFEAEDFMDSSYAVGLREIDEEVATNKEVGGKETESGMSWSYLVLCLTVLIGLIGGRVFALLLTLSWFLVLKLSKTLPRYREVSMIKTFDDRSG
ncbi:uncharacterized protein [Henckelia pumila]|uniref:uncharacterized protein n=1 Tax=Henckelia pumila TaxID=405737 RepID=UPI003C6E05D1